MTFTVDWALKTNYLSIYLDTIIIVDYYYYYYYFYVYFFNLFIHILNTLHIQTKTNHQSQQGEEKYSYTNIQINSTDKQTNRWTHSHGSACNFYSFVFCFFTKLHVLPCVPVCVCSLHYKTLLTYHNLSFNQIFVEMPIIIITIIIIIIIIIVVVCNDFPCLFCKCICA